MKLTNNNNNNNDVNTPFLKVPFRTLKVTLQTIEERLDFKGRKTTATMRLVKDSNISVKSVYN